jgi:type IV secretory pathway VirD2 relaxase
MIGKTIIGRSFKGCVAYQFRKLEQGKGTVLLSRGVRDYAAEVMTWDFEQQRRLNPALGRAVWHTAISFPPEEKERLTNDKMAAIAVDYLEGMGLAKGQYAVIRHDDRPHPHFHIVANRVADNGRSVGDGHNYSRSEMLLRELERKYELTPVLRSEKRQQLTNVPAHDQVRIRLREAVQACAQVARSLLEFTQTVEGQRITVQLHRTAAGEVTGISFEQQGQRFKGSQLGRALSFGALIKAFELNNQQQEKQLLTRVVTPRL